MSLRSCICLCLTVFVCVTPGSSAIVVLVPRAFQKYSTCMVHSDFLISGKNSPLGEGGGRGGGQKPIVNLALVVPEDGNEC